MKTTLFLFTFLFSTLLFAQKENNIWYFGDHAGLDFNSGSPVALTNSSMFTLDNCTSVADGTTGTLLFYSNGVDVWNKNHAVMPNGSGLLGNTTGGNSAYAVRQPGSTSIYYLFTVDAFAGPNGLRYSIIDMSLQSGLGNVTATKNVQLLNPSTEKIAAVKHANNQDIWIVTHPWNSNSFHSYLLSNTGLNITPVISNVGSTHSGGTLGTYNACGQISVSPQGDKVAVAIYDLQQYELFDFNNNTGALSNQITITGHPNAWGAEFSPDGSKLYTTTWIASSDLYQFDLSSNNQSTINSSATIVGTITSPNPNYKAGYLELAPDNKIYVAKFSDNYLGVISSPNTLGIASNYVDNGVHLAGKLSQAGLPVFLQTNTNSLLVSVNSATVCPNACTTLNASTNGGTAPYGYMWSPGGQTTSSMIACPTSATSYSVVVTDAMGFTATGVTQIAYASNPVTSVGGTTTIYQGSSSVLTASGGSTYLWNTGQSTASIVVTPPGTTSYTVWVTNSNGCSDSSSITVTVIPEPINPCDTAGTLHLPNAFSPNDDNENDELQIYYGNFSCIESFIITIYDRWGEKIFESADPHFKWNGSYLNKRPETDVFSYHVKVTMTNGEKVVRKGNVSMIK